ncbi:hypothetical protein D5F01_LYC10596 [Larimichthys crocea]|uniref:Uncharacterized protein n=1 Tax=Larimichthys crocea TaxID=215358 RepID=A0A6G0II73_LARCR|nr:hypothetical protein D5F01_LYC10596 [Larimichthys crocea]
MLFHAPPYSSVREGVEQLPLDTGKSVCPLSTVPIMNNRLCDKSSHDAARGPHKCRGREGMEESFETFEEELGPPRADPPPQKPVRQIRRPEMYATRRVREEMAPVPQQPRGEPRALHREPSYPRATSLHKQAVSTQSTSQLETPWENVTLNRCLFVVVTILVLTSGFQRLHGKNSAWSEDSGGGGRIRPSSKTVMHITTQTTIRDLDDDEEDEEEEEDDDIEVKRRKPKRGGTVQTWRGLRNKPLPDKNLMKRRGGKLKNRRAKKVRDEEIKDKNKRDKTEEPEEAVDDEDGDEVNEEAAHKIKKLEEQKERKSQKG